MIALLKGLKSEPYLNLNINGFEVEVRKADYTRTKGKSMKLVKTIYFNAYVELKGSNILSESFLNYPTYREGDVLGVDTNHAHNDGQGEADRLADALQQIGSIILRYKEVVKNAD